MLLCIMAVQTSGMWCIVPSEAKTFTQANSLVLFHSQNAPREAQGAQSSKFRMKRNEETVKKWKTVGTTTGGAVSVNPSRSTLPPATHGLSNQLCRSTLLVGSSGPRWFRRRRRQN